MKLNEDFLLEQTLAIAENSYKEAYFYLLKHKEYLEQGIYPQIYYFLSCLSAGNGNSELGIYWLKEAIEEKGYWYRPEILEDDDLKLLWNNSLFLKLKKVSTERYRQALKTSQPVFSWTEKTQEQLLVALHGNGQNGTIAREQWSFYTNKKIQVESIQSSIPDCVQRFRWNYDETNYLEILPFLEKIEYYNYKKIYWAGFSAGCDILLRTLALTNFSCNSIVLQSPWIPFIDEKLNLICSAFREKDISLYISCGTLDLDCMPMAEKLFHVCQQQNVKVAFSKQKDECHHFPINELFHCLNV